MSLTEPPQTGLQRLQMSWGDYLGLPERPRAEWVAGEVVVSPPVGSDHGIAVVRLGVAVTRALPDLLVMTEVGIRLPGDRVRAPDLMVTTERPTTRFVEGPVILVAEVLSPATRSEDLLRKGPEYAAAGVGQYWVLDPEGFSLEISENRSGSWELVLRLDEHRPTGEVPVADHGVVLLDLADLLPR